MKKIIALVLSVALVFLLFVPVSAIEFNKGSVDIESIRSEVEAFVSEAILINGDDYAVSDYDNIALGTEIPGYMETDNGNSVCLDNVQFYPVVSENEIIGLLEVYLYPTGDVSFAYSEGTACEMNQFASIGFAIYCHDFIVDVIPYQENAYSTHFEYTTPFSEITQLHTYDVLETSTSSNLRASLPNSYSLNVPTVLQPGSSNCWAACVVSVGEYQIGGSYTVADVEREMGLQNQPAPMSVIKDALKRVYGYTSSAIQYSITANQIMNYIYSGDPIIAGCTTPGALVGHAVVIRGYGSSSSSMSLNLMDPAQGRVTVSVVAGSGFSYSNGGHTWSIDSFVA